MVTALVAPRIRTRVKSSSTLASEAIDLAERNGLVLDDWQRMVLGESMGRTDGDRWSAMTVALVMPRQNGKDAVIEARELAGLFLLGEEIVHSAHLSDTTDEHFRRLASLIEESDELSSQLKAGRVKGIQRYHGGQKIMLANGAQLRFRTRTSGGGRGWSCDCLIFNEAMFLPEFALSAIVPTGSARKPQVWFAGSSVDQEVHEHGLALARLRERALSDDPGPLLYFEWSLPYEHPDEVPDDVLSDAEAMRPANPAMETRISVENVAQEIALLEPRSVAVERGGVGDWPDTAAGEKTVISLEAWGELADEKSKALDPVCLAFDVSPERTSAIGAAGRRADGLIHVEVVQGDYRKGTGKLPGKLAELEKRHQPAAIVCAGSGPVASLEQVVRDEGVIFEKVTEPEHAQACGRLVDLVEQKQLRHLGTTELRAALKGAKQRPLGDAWAWSRKRSSVDISPLVAATLAVRAVEMELEAGEMEIF